MSARWFHLKVKATDDRGISRTREFIVIARDDQEAYDELAEVFHMHGEIETWRVAETLGVEELSQDNAFARDYAVKGPHSYYDAI